MSTKLTICSLISMDFSFCVVTITMWMATTASSISRVSTNKLSHVHFDNLSTTSLLNEVELFLAAKSQYFNSIDLTQLNP